MIQEEDIKIEHILPRGFKGAHYNGTKIVPSSGEF